MKEYIREDYFEPDCTCPGFSKAGVWFPMALDKDCPVHGEHRHDYVQPDDGPRLIPPDRGNFEVIMAETEAQLREILGPYYDLWEGKKE